MELLSLKNKKNGISMTVLIITIVVVLILASAIILTLSKNDVIHSANTAKDQSDIATGRDILDMFYFDKASHANADVELDEYLDYLEENGYNTKTENGKGYVSVNDKIYEITMDDGGYGVKYVGEGKIEAPRITNIEVVKKSSNSISIKVTAIRMEEGTYYYYIGKDKENLETLDGSNATGEYTFSNLAPSNVYYIKVVAQGKAGDKSDKIIEVNFETVPDATFDNISYSVTWKDGKATLTLSTSTKYKIQTSKDNTSYNDIQVVEGLKDGDVVYARLTDGNTFGSEIAINITDDVKPAVSIESESITTKSIAVNVKANDNESGLNGTYKYYITDVEGEYDKLHGQNSTGKYTFDNLIQNTTYYIKVEVEDNAGNKNESTTVLKTMLIPPAKDAIKTNIVWNKNGKAQITLSTETIYKIEYSTNRSTWTGYSAPLEFENGSKVYISLTDGLNRGEDYTLNIEDKEGPQIDVSRVSVSTNSITVKVNAQDKVAGMDETVKYNYYIKTSEENDYRLIESDVTNNTYTFNGLKSQTTYNIRVSTTDILGNIGYGNIDVTTSEFSYVTGNVTFENISWENKSASVNVINNTQNGMQYKVIKEGEEIDLNGNWQTTNEKSIVVSNLKNNYSVIVRLYDGTNTTAGYATCTIQDKTPPSINVNGISNEWTNQNVVLTINATDTESGLQENCYSFDGGSSWQKGNTKEYDKNQNAIVIKVRDEAGNIATYNTLNITNIDRTPPVLDLDVNTTSNSIDVKISSVVDEGVGLAQDVTYKYYLTTDSTKIDSIQGEESKEKGKKYEGLSQNTTYYIKVEVADKLGNLAKEYRTITTGTLDANISDLKISDVTWKDKKASVIITNNSDYDMEYQIVKNGDEFDNNGNWITSLEKSLTINELLSGDTIYARLTDGTNASGTVIKEVIDNIEPTIKVTGNPVDFTNQNVILKVEATDNESGLSENCYSFDDGKTWQKENTKEYDKNQNGIVIKVKDEAGNIAVSDVIEITKIDKEGPSINIKEEEKATNKIKVSVSSNDTGVGISDLPEYTYYIKEENEEYSKIATSNEKVYTYENLKSNTKYTIKVESKDKLGNIGESTIDITTNNLLYAVGDISFENIIWSNGKAKVTIKNNISSYNMEYQIRKKGEKIDINGTWITLTEKEKIIDNLDDKDVIYARITDGVNSTEGYATCNISNPAKKSYTEEELAKSTTRQDYDILALNISNDKISVKINEKIDNAYLYNYYYKTINDEEYTLISTCSYYNDPAIITNVKEGNIYKIKVLVMDSDGNVTRCENTSTAIALEQAKKDTVYNENRTYIDNSSTLEILDENGSTSNVQAGFTMSLPASFKVTSESVSQKDGIVLADKLGNEYVWVPVYDAIYDGVTEIPTNTATANSKTYKPMATLQKNKEGYYEGLIYTYNGSLSYRQTSSVGIGTTGYKEPALVTNSSKDGYTWDVTETLGNMYDSSEANYKNILGFESINEFGKYMANEYNNMINAVDSYGGFYVGRYETTYEEQNGNIIVGSKKNSQVLSSNNWYKLNLYQDSKKYSANPYNKSNSVTSSMIWGSQWDAMLNYILKGDDKGKITTKTGQKKNVVSASGTDDTDKVNNIYDLGSNVFEYTQEANSYQNRVYRGGSYDSTFNATISTRANTKPTDLGPGFGSRLSLYMKSTNDVTAPSVNIKSVTSTSNTITVDASAVDKETGVSSYLYYISTDNSQYRLVEENNSNKYTYTGLKQDTTYYIKVVAKDGTGNTAEGKQAETKTKVLGNVAKTAISVEQKYGSNGNGILKLKVSDEYVSSGYYIEYQVLNAGESINMSGTWTKQDTISNLKNGQVVYATLYDGINRTSDYYTQNIDGLEEFDYYKDSTGNSSETKTLKYTDDSGNIAYIPAGFKVGITDTVKNINDGLVIEDNNGNQFVWVPVEDAIYDSQKGTLPTSSSSTSTYKPMARYQKGYDTNSTNQYFEGITYNFASTYKTGSYVRSANNTLGTSNYREPGLITNSSDYTWDIQIGKAKGATYDTLEDYYKYMGFGKNSGVEVFNSYTEFGQYMNEEYSKMVKSVEKYGGFYVGRYETSLEGTFGNKDAVATSKLGGKVINNQMWYKDYYYQDSNINKKNPYYNTNSVTSSMIWGSQWDAILNWMLKDEKTKEYVTKITGNHTEVVQTSGQNVSDLAKNIFDMSANVTEYVQLADSTYRRQARGSTAGNTSSTFGQYTASSYHTSWLTPVSTTAYYGVDDKGVSKAGYYLGSRMSLYINDTSDTTKPQITLKEVKKSTNNIEVSVNAYDNESGISKYKYSISYKDFSNSSFTDSDILKQAEVYGTTYIFDNLIQNQSYYIKIEAINGAGLVAEVYTGIVKTDVLNVQEGNIIREKVYGKNGNGKAYFVINDETTLKEDGYYLQHQIDKDGSGYKEDGEWITSDTVTGLSVGDVIYTRLYDGNNLSSYYMTTSITELETFSDVYETTQKYEEYENVVYEDGTSKQELVGTAYIPAGFRVATSSMTKHIKSGLVIEDENGNQFVWIPVKDAVYDGKTTLAQSGNTSTYKPMARYQVGYDTSTKEQYFEGMSYSYSGTRSYVTTTANKVGTSTYREPSLVTNSTANYSWVFTAGDQYDAVNYKELADIGVTSAVSMGQDMNDKFTNVVQSVQKYGGFYVGRYETSLSGTTVMSKEGNTPMASINWYKMYLYEDSNYASNPYNKSNSVVSSMVWGSQWDAMLNYILEGTDKEKVTIVTGNHSGTRAVTGAYGSDIMNNIFDLSSNVLEWTQEAYVHYYRVRRGGYYNVADVYPASYRNTSLPTGSYGGIGSRLTLYLK